MYEVQLKSLFFFFQSLKAPIRVNDGPVQLFRISTCGIGSQYIFFPLKEKTFPTEWLIFWIVLLYLDLKKYTEYTIEVSASTTTGEGLCSAPLHVLTDEDGKSELKLWCVIACSLNLILCFISAMHRFYTHFCNLYIYLSTHSTICICVCIFVCVCL